MKKILVVDDEAIIAMNTSLLLKSEGYSTVEVYSGMQCLEELKGEDPPDLVLLDIDLGPNKMDGTETAQRINKLYSIPVVFYSGHTDRETLTRTDMIKNYGYVQKAAGNRQFLLATIRMALRLFDTEQESRKKERYYRLLADNSTDVIVTFDFDFNITYVSPASAQVVGYEPREVLGHTIKDFVAPDSWDDALHYHQQLLKEARENVTVEIEHFRKDGSALWAEDTLSLLRDDNGTVIGFLATVRDISKRKLYEQRLRASEDFHRESESRLNAILSSIDDIVFAFDREGRFTFYNLSSMEDLFVPPEHFLGKKHNEVLPPYLHERFEEAFRKILLGESDRYEYRMELGGKIRWFYAVHSPIVIRGKVEGSVSVVRETTERKQQEERLRQTIEKRENSIKETHHRIKNNLAIITSLIRLKQADEGDRREFDALISQIDTIRIVHEKLYRSDDLETIDIRQYLNDLIDGVRAMTGSNFCDIRADLDEMRLPPDQAIPLGLITSEIVMNAIQHGRVDHRRLLIELTLRPGEEEKLVYTLGNNGSPIPEDVDPNTVESLGLQMIQLLVGQLKGSMTIRKAPSPLFTITIPISEEEEEE